MPKINIVGCGPGSMDYLTTCATKAIEESSTIAGSKRLLELFKDQHKHSIALNTSIEEFLSAVEQSLSNGVVSILVSGDPGFHSLAKNVIDHFGADACRVIPGISSIQVAFSRLAQSWENAKLISAHGELPDCAPKELAKFSKIAILGGGSFASEWISDASQALEQTHEIFLCRDLTLPEEIVRKISTSDIAKELAISRSIIVCLKNIT